MTPQPPDGHPPDIQAQRACGAACLSAVYKALGKDVPAAEIWPQIAKVNRFGVLSSTTHLMALNALSAGFAAVAVQARHPLHLLGICRDRGIAAIINHRLRPDSKEGHYSILAGLDGKDVFLSDPAFGVMRRIRREDFRKLWQPAAARSEILGGVLIGISPAAEQPPPCEFCRQPIPAQVDCPNCGRAVLLRPAGVLGCIREGCVARMWNYLCCPSCDYMWTFSEARPSSGEAPRAVVPRPVHTAAAPEAVDLTAAFAALDRLCELVRSVPGAEEHPDLRAHLADMEAGKQKIQQAQAEEIAAYKARADWLATVRAESAQQAEVHRKKMEESKAPPARLDGSALGQALLKNLGLK